MINIDFRLFTELSQKELFPGQEVIAPSLGRNLSGNTANVTVNLVEPFSVYGDRVNQLDLRVGKIVRVGKTRARLALDLFNALNAATVMTENPNYAAFRRPTSITTARFAKVTMQFDFSSFRRRRDISLIVRRGTHPSGRCPSCR